jgi:hypothetical protein
MGKFLSIGVMFSFVVPMFSFVVPTPQLPSASLTFPLGQSGRTQVFRKMT